MKTSPTWNHSHLLSTESLSEVEVLSLFDLARSYKDQPNTANSPLQGKIVLSLFIEPSTRTRIAFEVAAKRLGADFIHVEGGTSSLTKGESLKDMALNLKALGIETLILRHPSAGTPQLLTKYLDFPVINAGDGSHEHPSQALLDAFTLLEHFGGSLKGKKISIIGDILHSRVARSNIFLLKTLGASVTLAGPRTLLPEAFKSLGASITHSLEDALLDADAIMMLRIQKERINSQFIPSTGEFSKTFGLHKHLLPYIKPSAVFLHPGPINRGVEIDNFFADSSNSLILKQVENGVFVRMAILNLCFNHSISHK